ncbi:GntR family transcriptional regulator [Micromonospora humidisoli]|uniref:GntR family transcriptional regulator n=1 Tax=Micromonospora humidisoli TaxID=2807622 RepID=A0ABS2JCP3_9ACTN|nr:GntR family transcriptional regulator [Micromonospora humidisoli]MBM7084322.1 GntR family transcriptional regulator [Micromonospora humidisoli]
MPTPHYGQPRYRTIADELKRRIEGGTIAPGALLPAESALTAEFRASRGTIRQAIAVLRDAGAVTTEHGRGTYANPHRIIHQSDHSNDLEATQREISADSKLAAIFGVDEGSPLTEHEFVTRKNGRAHKVIRVYQIDRSMT